MFEFKNPNRIFLYTGLFLGILYTFIFPPFQVSDEALHFCKAYALSEGDLFPRNSPSKAQYYVFNRPVSLDEVINFGEFFRVTGGPTVRVPVTDIWEGLKIPLNPEKRADVESSNVAVYSPVGYIAPTAVLLVGRLLHLPPLILMYLGRLAAGGLWLAMIYASLRLVPRLAGIFGLLALFPACMSIGWGITPDSCLVGASFLLTAAFIRCAHGAEERLGRQHLLPLFLLCALVGCIKPGYVFLYLLFWLIPPAKLGGGRRALLLFGALTLIVFLPILFWSALNTILQTFFTHGIGRLQGHVDEMNPSGQLYFALTHPFNFLRTFLRSFVRCALGDPNVWTFGLGGLSPA